MIGQIVDRLTDEVRRIWCYRWLVMAVTATLMAAAVAFAFRAPNTYEAWGQLYVSRQTPLSAAAESVSLADLRSSSTYVVQKTLLNDDNLGAVARALEPQHHFTKLELAWATAALKKAVRLVDGGDGFVEIHYTDTDPHRAQAVVQLILNQFMSGSYERSQQELRLAGDFLDQQISIYGDLISQSQAKIAAIRRRWGLIATEAAEDAVLAPAQPQERASADVIKLPPPPAARSEAAERVSQLETRLASLLTVDTDRHPDVVAARHQLEEARAQSKTEKAETAPATPAMSSPAPLRRLRVWRRPAPPPEAAAELAELERRDELLRTNYQELLAKRAAAQMSEAVSGADRTGKLLVTREPATPTLPSGPHRALYLAAGLLAAIVGGFGAGYLRAVTRGIIVSPREIEEAIQLPVIGTVSLERAWSTRPPVSAAIDSAHPPERRQWRLRVSLPMGKAS